LLLIVTQGAVFNAGRCWWWGVCHCSSVICSQASKRTVNRSTAARQHEWCHHEQEIPCWSGTGTVQSKTTSTSSWTV